jgi:hypothetical protein
VKGIRGEQGRLHPPSQHQSTIHFNSYHKHTLLKTPHHTHHIYAYTTHLHIHTLHIAHTHKYITHISHTHSAPFATSPPCPIQTPIAHQRCPRTGSQLAFLLVGIASRSTRTPDLGLASMPYCPSGSSKSLFPSPASPVPGRVSCETFYIKTGKKPNVQRSTERGVLKC